MEKSIFIVVNSCPKITTIERRALDTKSITVSRVENGLDIMAPKRFAEAQLILFEGAQVVMYQGGARTYRAQYGSGQFIAAGKVAKAPRTITEDDKQIYNSIMQLNIQCFNNWSPAGIVFYEFTKGLSNQPLRRESINYEPNQGVNFIEIKPGEGQYSQLKTWWDNNI